ncbi:MAG TPA: helix-turn-helix domain-containing protein [Polyangiaceae bacterium]|nr:helix-turn-helix domain-containing protein [Polyangiaceae bacterium]
MKSGDGSAEQSSRTETMLPPSSGVDEYTFPVAGDTTQTLSFRVTTAPPSVDFTLGERSVLKAIAAGMTNDEIAEERGSSRRAVMNLVRSICAKLNLANRAELERHLAAEAGCVSAQDLRASNSLGGLAREKIL